MVNYMGKEKIEELQKTLETINDGIYNLRKTMMFKVHFKASMIVLIFLPKN